MVSHNRPQFVLFGSSIVQISLAPGGWGSILSDLYDRKADIMIRGYSGWNSRLALNVLHKVFPVEAPQHPSLVIVYFGGNDAMEPHKSGLGAHVPFPEYLSNMKKIALHLKSLSNEMRMIFLTTPPVDEGMVQSYFGNYFDGQERKNESCRIYAEGLVDLCKQLDIKVINLWTAFQDRHDWGATYLTDGIHLTSEGSKVMVREILKVLREAEWEPSLYWLSMPTEFGEYSTQFPIDPYALSTINVSRFIASWKTEWMNEKELEEHNSKSSIHIPS